MFNLRITKNKACCDEPLCCRFKEIADFVVQALDPPQYVDNADSSSPAEEQSKTCEYCAAEYSEGAFKEHLVTVHAELLFHCEECDTYVDRKDFILHMSLHAVQYASDSERSSSTKSTKKVKKKAGEGENAEDQKYPDTSRRIEEEPQDRTGNGGREDGNEFSDHSDTENAFGPLPESVFEAIEDSQDSRPADGPEIVAPTPSIDGSTATKTTKPHKKSRTCPICSRVYTASSSYFYHMKHFHQKSKEHECDVCGKKFATKANLAQHGSIHTGECQFECSQCDKRFRSKASRYIHEQTHSGVKRYACAACPKRFRWRAQLARHAARHAARHGGARPHACASCPRAFAVRADLLRHARTHVTRRLACLKCGRAFAQRRYLKVHMDKKHSALVQDTPAPQTDSSVL